MKHLLEILEAKVGISAAPLGDNSNYFGMYLREDSRKLPLLHVTLPPCLSNLLHLDGVLSIEIQDFHHIFHFFDMGPSVGFSMPQNKLLDISLFEIRHLCHPNVDSTLCRYHFPCLIKCFFS